MRPFVVELIAECVEAILFGSRPLRVACVRGGRSALAGLDEPDGPDTEL